MMTYQPGHISPVLQGFLKTVFRATSTLFGYGQCPTLQKKVAKRILVIMEESVLLFKSGNSDVMCVWTLQVKVFRFKLSCLPLGPSVTLGDCRY